MVKDALYYSRQFKRRRFLRRLVFLLFILSMVTGGIIYFFRAPYFRVKNIEIDGLSGLAREQVLRETKTLIFGNMALVFPYDNMFVVSTDKLAENLSRKFLDIKDLTVARQWPSGLKIGGSERVTWAIYCRAPVLSKSEAIGYKTQSSELLRVVAPVLSKSEAIGYKTQSSELSRVVNACFLADSGGMLFSGAPDFQGNLLLKIYDERGVALKTGDAVFNLKDFSIMAEFVVQLENDLNNRVSRIVLKDGGVKEFYLKDWYVLTDDSVDYKTARNNLNLTLSEIGDNRGLLEYIDLRFSNKIFYKFK
ncbi:MAG: FtsQ-type POTRA domain-containing protein [Candidatus Niyogibacteria bacterium]|nr:FtsQ-type POTRA domain-containing protein [Candidatus Niyogibacteria bacterium]